jgi:DNA repair photolyase
MYSHDYLGDGNYFNKVYYKRNIIESLERELSSPSWKREIVNIGGVTDSYQPIEKELKIMREVLKLMIKYRTPVIISTKSDLILRDYDLIKELADITYVNIACTITAMDESIRTIIEPNGCSSMRRFEVLKEFRKTNASIGVHVMPIIPYLTDSYDNIDEIYRMASIIKADYVLPGTLYLRGKTRDYFLNFLKNYDLNLYNKFILLYKTGGASKEYKDSLYTKVNEIKNKYGLTSNYMKPLKAKLK